MVLVTGGYGYGSGYRGLQTIEQHAISIVRYLGGGGLSSLPCDESNGFFIDLIAEI